MVVGETSGRYNTSVLAVVVGITGDDMVAFVERDPQGQVAGGINGRVVVVDVDGGKRGTETEGLVFVGDGEFGSGIHLHDGVFSGHTTVFHHFGREDVEAWLGGGEQGVGIVCECAVWIIH